MTSAHLIAFAVAGTVLVGAGAAPAVAGQPHHHRLHHSHGYEEAVPRAYDPQAYGQGWQAAAIARATREMQDAPGVTNELAPDAKATATGGPVGGVPGFSGH